jgi:hypothetical protein
LVYVWVNYQIDPPPTASGHHVVSPDFAARRDCVYSIDADGIAGSEYGGDVMRLMNVVG